MSSTADLEGALQLKRAGKLDEAVIALEEILGRSASNVLALTHLADVQLRRHKTTEAAEALDRAEAAGGTTAFTARIRGELRYRERRWREAAACFRDAAVLGDRGIWSLLQLARCHLRLGELDAARGAAAQAAERDERASAPWVLLGEVALREGSEDAVDLLERAHERAPDDEYAYAKLIEARLLQLPPGEREREVEILLRSGGSRDQANRHLLGVLARLRSEGGDEHRAAETWRERREQHGDPYARKMEAYALRRAGELEQAAVLLRACLLEDPEDLILFRTYVHLQNSRGALDELRVTLEQLVPVAGPVVVRSTGSFASWDQVDVPGRIQNPPIATAGQTPHDCRPGRGHRGRDRRTPGRAARPALGAGPHRRRGGGALRGPGGGAPGPG